MTQSVLLKKTLLNYCYQNSQNLELRYYLLSGEYGDLDIPIHKGYGINVKLCFLEKILDEKAIEDIETSREKMACMINYLCEKAVTPANLQYIIEDTLGMDDTEILSYMSA